MRELIEELYSCRSRHDDCLKEWVDCHRPEPFIGNLHAKFAIIGANPGSYEGRQRIFHDPTDYVNYHEKKFFDDASEEEWAKKWPKGYLEAYRLLMDNPHALLSDFNKNAIILNVVKCSTKIKLSGIPKWNKEKAKNNCKGYLIQQLENIQPPVVLSHGRFACNTIIEILRDVSNYKVSTISSFSSPTSNNLNTLAELNMNDLSNHYVYGKDKEGHNILFLFNKHLSFYGSAIYRLKQNLDKKRTLVKQVTCT